MSIWKPLRWLYIKTTDYSHGFQGERAEKIISFYKLWSLFYEFSVKLDPAYARELQNMIEAVVQDNDIVLDIGCGTGLGTIPASKITKKVIGIDFSFEMISKLNKNIRCNNIENIELINGEFPDAVPNGIKFNSIISSFTMVHFAPERRIMLYKNMYNSLENNGRLGLFSAQGEIAPAFEKRKEIESNLESAGFHEIKISDVSDIYRIVEAKKVYAE